MFERRIPEWVRHPPAPGAAGFAVLAALDAGARACLISVFPLLLYRALGSAGAVSAAYLAVGLVALAAALLIPWATRRVPRRWMLSLGAATYPLAAAAVLFGGADAALLSLVLYSLASVTVFVCLNAYVLDYVAQAQPAAVRDASDVLLRPRLGGGPVSRRLARGGLDATSLPAVGRVRVTLCARFWWMRLGDGKLIRRSRRPAANPLSYLWRFAAQPRLLAGYLFAMLRSCGWWVYVVYLPIFAIESGLPEQTGGVALSLTNALLFVTPLMLRWTRHHPVRVAVRLGFLASGLLFIAATLLSASPWLALACLYGGSAFLVLLDICGGLPFLMAVKPSERTEMSAVYSTYRDVSGIVAPGAASILLLVAPVQGLFALSAVGLLAAWGIASRIPHRLGSARRGAPVAAAQAAPVPAGRAAPGAAGRRPSF